MSVPVVEPEVVVVGIGSSPPIPDLLKLIVLEDPNTEELADDCPVIVWGDYTYWPLSYADERTALCLVAYDLRNEVVNTWELAGARYVVTVTVDKSRQEITLLGKYNATVTVSWNVIGSVVPRNPQYFWILNLQSQLAWRAAAANFVRLDTRAVADDQLWLVDNGRQAFFPKASSPAVCLDHRDGETLVILAPTNWGRTHQRWIITDRGILKPAASTVVASTSLLNSVVVEVPSATASDRQLWYMKPYVPSPDLSTDQFSHFLSGESFTLINQGQILSSSGTGPLMLVPTTDTNVNSTLWFHNESGVLESAEHGLAITASGISSVITSPLTGGLEQQWALTTLGYLVCRANGLLMVARGGTVALARYDALGPAHQTWFLQLERQAEAYSQESRKGKRAAAALMMTQLTVTAQVSDEFWAGTSDQIFISFNDYETQQTLLFDGPSPGDHVKEIRIDLQAVFGKSAINPHDDVYSVILWQEGFHPIASDAWKLASITLEVQDEAGNVLTNYTFEKIDAWLDNKHPARKIIWSGLVRWGEWLNSDKKPVDLNKDTYPVGFMPYIGDLLSWREYDPTTIDGVGQILGIRNGRLIGEVLKPPRKTEVLQLTDDRHSYTWVFTPQGAIIYKLWDKLADRSEYTRHSQLGSGEPVICAGEMHMKQVLQNYVVTEVVAMVNDASGHYKPDGGACLHYVGQKLQDLGVDTDTISWYSK